MTLNTHSSVCFVGLENLPVLSRKYNQHGTGGEQVQHTLLARALVKRGFKVSMIVADYGQAEGEVHDGIKLFKAHGLTDGIPVIRFIHPRLTKLWSALKRADADVYYVSCSGPQLGIVALFAKQYRRRVVFRIAHDRDCDPNNLLIRFWRDKKIYEFGLRHAHVVLAQSEQQLQSLQTNYDRTSRLAAMLVEPSERDIPFAQRDVDVLWVNNLRPFKRPQLVIDLAKKLPYLRFHVIGGPQGGHESLYQDIQKQASTIPNLSFHGPVPYHDVNDFYARSRVFINTSESEGFPNSYLQAWRRGTPTVAFFDPDHVIERFGLGVNVSSLQEMATEVDRLAMSSVAWAETSTHCQSFMDERYADPVVLAPYLEALRA
ncbi:MAG: glycosyltransferase family 4 protein [Pseudomonadota bacterium]